MPENNPIKKEDPNVEIDTSGPEVDVALPEEKVEDVVEQTTEAPKQEEVETKKEETKEEPKKIIFVGRLIKDKGIKEFLIAAKKIVASHQDVNFLIYGEIDDHNPSSLSHEELKEMLHHRIRHMGNIPDIRIALKESHCVVLPSYREGMSRSLLEAAASGIPIITTNVPGCREIVEHTKNGYICNVRDSDDLANKILILLKLLTIAKNHFIFLALTSYERELSIQIDLILSEERIPLVYYLYLPKIAADNIVKDILSRLMKSVFKFFFKDYGTNLK